MINFIILFCQWFPNDFFQWVPPSCYVFFNIYFQIVPYLSKNIFCTFFCPLNWKLKWVMGWGTGFGGFGNVGFVVLVNKNWTRARPDLWNKFSLPEKDLRKDKKKTLNPKLDLELDSCFHLCVKLKIENVLHYFLYQNSRFFIKVKNHWTLVETRNPWCLPPPRHKNYFLQNSLCLID
jgi:hypothetical protein